MNLTPQQKIQLKTHNHLERNNNHLKHTHTASTIERNASRRKL